MDLTKIQGIAVFEIKVFAVPEVKGKSEESFPFFISNSNIFFL